jgi:TolA-binding protein
MIYYSFFVKELFRTYLIEGVILIGLALSVPAAYAQRTEPAQARADKVVAASSQDNGDSERSPSPEMLREQIKAQQLEINELRERLKKLEAMLETLASRQQASSSVTPTAEPIRTLAVTL